MTPLTNNCLATISVSLNLSLGTSPIGPAGTGKSETCKELARILGKPYYLFNCNEDVSFKLAERILTGIVRTGFWGVLDEFNRLNLQILSIMA